MSCGQTHSGSTQRVCCVNPSLPSGRQRNFEPCHSLVTCHIMAPCSFLESPWPPCSLSLGCGSLEIAAGSVLTQFLIIYWVQFHNKYTDHTFFFLRAVEHVVSMLLALFLIVFRIKHSKQEVPSLEAAPSLSYAQRKDDKSCSWYQLPPRQLRSQKVLSSMCLNFDRCAVNPLKQSVGLGSLHEAQQ